ncbi:MAG TPA: ABC transporter ATP-binding protein [Acidimicrobiales bacterium]|nr:ABC transporter ATP-binding protein [Acidimicrobiales bacterium]
MNVVSVDELVVRYGDVVAADGVSFTAAAGAVTALLGPNGAGKTTIVETCEGYRRPSAGSVRVHGLDPVADARTLLPRLGVMLQRGGIYPSMGIAAALGLFASYYARPASPAELLERVGLIGRVTKTPWRRLSGGEQQRASLALALIGNPDVVFLDEPTAGVDPQARQLVRSVITSLRDQGACVVVTTHELDEVERLADHVVIVDDGRVVADGTLASLTSDAALTFSSDVGIDVTALAIALDRAVIETSAGRYRVNAPSTPAMVAALTAWLASQDLEVRDLGSSRLEDVFLRLTGGAT